MNWHPITHHAVHEGNVFLRQKDDDDLLPSTRLGDWGLASAVERHADINGRVLVDSEALNRDLAPFIYKLRRLNDACPGRFEKKHDPIHEFRKLRREARQLAKRGRHWRLVNERIFAKFDACANRCH
jgi:hypothetical protein